MHAIRPFVVRTVSGPVTLTSSISRPDEPIVLRHLKVLVYIYFWLLVTEGALRKWFLPQLSAPLLIIRDPVALVIFFLVLKHNLVPRSFLLWCTVVLCAVFFAVSFFDFVIYENKSIFVTAYGLRTYFLHLPLIFVLPAVFTSRDVETLGKWILLLTIPMTALMILQFQVSPYHLLNTTSTGEGLQLSSANGRVRPSGTFSFITGIAQYYALAAALLLYAIVKPALYQTWLIVTSGLAMICAMAVSGSRLTVLCVIIVCCGMLVACMLQPKSFKRIYKALFALPLVFVIASQTSFFQEGVHVFSKRLENAKNTEDHSGGMSGRIIDNFLEPLLYIDDVPIFGHGLGMGTNVGSQLLTGRTEFLLAENEWTRIVLESGPILGFGFLALRIAIAIQLALQALSAARRGSALSLLLYFACLPDLILGQLGRPTTLGFMCLIGGLSLASARASISTKS